MSKNRRTLTIDEKVYAEFKLYCDKNDKKISKFAERVLFEYIENMKKNV